MNDEFNIFRRRSAGNLTVTETSPAMKIGPAPVTGHGYEILVPAASADDTLDVTFLESATEGGSYTLFHTHRQITSANYTLNHAGRLANRLPWVKCVHTIAGNGSENFGAVQTQLADDAFPNSLQVGDPS